MSRSSVKLVSVIHDELVFEVCPNSHNPGASAAELNSTVPLSSFQFPLRAVVEFRIAHHHDGKFLRMQIVVLKRPLVIYRGKLAAELYGMQHFVKPSSIPGEYYANVRRNVTSGEEYQTMVMGGFTVRQTIANFKRKHPKIVSAMTKMERRLKGKKFNIKFPKT